MKVGAAWRGQLRDRPITGPGHGLGADATSRSRPFDRRDRAGTAHPPRDSRVGPVRLDQRFEQRDLVLGEDTLPQRPEAGGPGGAVLGPEAVQTLVRMDRLIQGGLEEPGLRVKRDHPSRLPSRVVAQEHGANGLSRRMVDRRRMALRARTPVIGTDLLPHRTRDDPCARPRRRAGNTCAMRRTDPPSW